MKTKLLSAAAVIAAVFIAAASAQAQSGSGDFSVGVFGSYAPFFDGEAGYGGGAPDYSDAFEDGFGGGVEAGYRFHEKFSVLAGIGFERYSGEKYEGISFDDLDIVPVYVGAKLHFRSREATIDPYARLDAGLAYFSSVDVSYLGISEKYWESSWEPLFDVGLGLEYRLGRLGFFAEVRARYMARPEKSLGDYSRGESSWSAPVHAGVSWRF